MNDTLIGWTHISLHQHERQTQMSTKLREPAATPLVLIVDDEEAIATTVALIVEEWGYDSLVAARGRRALELALAHPPALVITDLKMPKMDGAQLIAALRDELPAHGTPAPPRATCEK